MDTRVHNAQVAELLQGQTAQRPVQAPTTGPDFGTILQDQLKVSGHAQTRLQSRNIQLDQQDWQRVLNGVNRAAEKGSRESLVMIDDVALVVSVKNRTVITAVDKQNLKDNVFTNIDSAVIV
jgi:flagellar operon protein